MVSQSSPQKTAPTTSNPKKSIAKKKHSKGSSSSAYLEPFLMDTTQLFSLNLEDYDESVRVMIKFIMNHPIFVPLTKVPKPPLPLHLLHTAFTRINIDDIVLETKITSDRIVPVHKSTFLRAIGVKENTKGFKVQEPTLEEFQLFLNHIGYNQDNRAKDFKKSIVSGLWTNLMHFIIRGLSDKQSGIDTLNKDWL